MEAAEVAGGLEFPGPVIARIREWIECEAGRGRSDLAREVCEWQGWHTATGEAREMACRLGLLELERRRVLQLPGRRSAVRRSMPAARWDGICDRQIRGGLEVLGKIELRLVSAAEDRDDSGQWNAAISGYHYLGYTPLVGAQRRYLIESEHVGVIGALGFSASARRLAPRDRWIGWSDEVRANHLHQVVCNSRFLIFPWVHVRNLASRVLGMASRRLVRDWRHRYGYEPVLIETFVDPKQGDGTSYRASNWIALGETRGRGRQDSKHEKQAGVKKIFAYPLCTRWRERLGVVVEESKDEDWAQREFGGADLGERRLERRFVAIGRDFCSRPRESIPVACNGDRAKTKAVYRFLGNDKVTLEKLLEPHQRATVERMSAHRTVLAVQDSTSFNYSAHPLTEGLGPVGAKNQKGLGIHLHDTLAITPEGLALGVIDAQVWTRDWEKKKNNRPIEERESAKWLRSYEAAAQMQAELKRTRVISVGDRESDLYELFAMTRAHLEAGGPDLLVRSRENRCLSTGEKHLRERVMSQPLAGYRDIALTARRGRGARVAKLSVRYCEVELSAPQGKKHIGPIRLWAVHACERRPPNDVEPVEWMLLSTVEVRGFDDACQTVDWYAQRWMVEVYHRTIKSGCRIEERQLGSVARLENCLAIDMIVAWRVMYLTWLGRTNPDVPCTIVFEDDQWRAVDCFLRKTPNYQEEVPSLQTMIGWIGKLGGHLGRKCDGPPGTKSLWIGLQRSDDITATAQVFFAMNRGP